MKELNGIRLCSRCVMDTTDPLITFDENGICHYCKLQDILEAQHPLNGIGRQKLDAIVREMKRSGKRKKYDCVIGVSGGTDSTYQLYLANKFGLRPLVVHFDNGWNSNQAVSNIEKATQKYGFDLQTYVVDWEEFKDLQVAFLKASTPDSEIPTDIAIQAILYRVAAEEGIKYVIKGHSFRTEGRVPLLWSYGDGRYVKSLNKLFGRTKLKSYPNLTLLKLMYYAYFKRIKQVRLLYYVEYNKEKVKLLLTNEIGWQDYGGHHYESIYTRFYQGYILPRKFNIDKRKREFSALIRCGQLSRKEALRRLREEPPLSPEQVKEDYDYVIKKLGLTSKEFEAILNEPPKTFLDFPTYYPTINRLKKVIKYLYRFISSSTPLILYESDIKEVLKLKKSGKLYVRSL